MNSFDHSRVERAGVLLVNLGTPDEPTPAAVRRYLAEFLSDRRVVDVARWIWWPVLHGIILRVRPGPVARKYETVWMEQGAPLLVHSQALADATRESLEGQTRGPLSVALAMSYGNPSVEDAVARLRQEGVTRLLVVPLFPQYSGTTTAAVFDVVARALGRVRWVPELRFVGSYASHPDYIAALERSVRQHWEQHTKPDRLVMSFHGIPQRFFHAGDPYHCQCHVTARLLATALGLAEDEWEVAFQSRFGREPWLQPYLDQRLPELAGDGLGHVQVICPGFAADCLETLEEIQEENQEVFLQAGGKTFSYIPALNSGADHVRLMTTLVQEHTQGWPQFAADYDPARTRERADAAQARAMAMGAGR
ncbi:MAG: ferrochelatase [Xanthomonadales bacterium]|nr:ferrochelatase [Xanthomonadales bacterium]